MSPAHRRAAVPTASRSFNGLDLGRERVSNPASPVTVLSFVLYTLEPIVKLGLRASGGEWG